jgi:hypothetical protein
VDSIVSSDGAALRPQEATPLDAVGVADTVAAADAEPDGPQFDPRIEIPSSLGPVRRALLEHMIDSIEAGPQSVAQIIAALPVGTAKGTAEASILREFKAGRILRVGAGLYALAPPKPPAPPEPPRPGALKLAAVVAGFSWPSDPEALAGKSEDEWFAALAAWHADPTTWVDLGPQPDHAENRVPFDVMLRWKDRIRKRLERVREADAEAARRAAADAELRDQLIAVCQGNIIHSRRLDDVAPIRAALETVPLDTVLEAIRQATDRKLHPGNQPATSWRDERLLKAIAVHFARFTIAPAMAASWAAAGTAPQKPADVPSARPAVPSHQPQNPRQRPSLVALRPFQPKPSVPVETVRKMHGEGKGQADIAAALGVSRMSVWRALKDDVLA